jgi:NADH-quinone oxidoreductase subunit N
VNPSTFNTGLVAVLPEILLLILAFGVMGYDLFLPEQWKRLLGRVTIGGLIVILAINLLLPATGSAWGGMVYVDGWVALYRMLFIGAAILVCFISLDARGLEQTGEYYGLIVFATMGMSLMASAHDLIMLYLAIETTSMTLYLLAGFLRNSKRSAEAGLKYFLFGVFASTIMLYGFSLLYGFTGTTGYEAVAAAMSKLGAEPSRWLVMAPLLLVMVGFGFKIAAVPFHFWTPDVYEGAPTPITAFISVASKAAGFAVLMRFLLIVYPLARGEWVALISALSVVTMTLGNVLALVQHNIKRMLAYSSIAQAGYILIGVVAVTNSEVTPSGPASVLFYLGVYVLTNIAAFAVVIAVTNVLGTEEISGFAGLSRRSLGLALAMAAAMLSLGGVPPLAGFFAKLYIFASAMGQGLIWLVVIGVLNSTAALYYYLMVVKYIFVNRSEGDEQPMSVAPALNFGLWVAVAGILALGVFTTPWYTLAAKASIGF